MKFKSFVPFNFKTNIISCLVYRAFRICSRSTLFENELSFLKEYFLKNGFTCKIIDNVIRKTLFNIYHSKPVEISCSKNPVYIRLEYLGFVSNVLKRKLSILINKFYPQIQPKFIFNSSNSIGHLFNYKDKLPPLLVSNVIYKFTCGQCSAAYIGETQKQLRVRVCQHRGVSFRNPSTVLSNQENSKILEHSFDQNHPISEKDFKILTTCNSYDLRTLESIFIYDQKPHLNSQGASTELFILK